MPMVRDARKKYSLPAVREFVAELKKISHATKIVLMQAHAIRCSDANMWDADTTCPNSLIRPHDYALDGGANRACYPKGSVAEIAWNGVSYGNYPRINTGPACQMYAIARGTFQMLGEGAHLLAPCGQTFETIRGSQAPDDACRAMVDAEYGEGASWPLPMPFAPNMSGAVRTYRHIVLHERGYPTRDPGDWDPHANLAGAYLNALVLFATMSGRSPIGAATPPQLRDRLATSEIDALQQAAAETVAYCGAACGLACHHFDQDATSSPHVHFDAAPWRHLDRLLCRQTPSQAATDTPAVLLAIMAVLALGALLLVGGCRVFVRIQRQPMVGRRPASEMDQQGQDKQGPSEEVEMTDEDSSSSREDTTVLAQRKTRQRDEAQTVKV